MWGGRPSQGSPLTSIKTPVNIRLISGSSLPYRNIDGLGGGSKVPPFSAASWICSNWLRLVSKTYLIVVSSNLRQENVGAAKPLPLLFLELYSGCLLEALSSKASFQKALLTSRYEAFDNIATPYIATKWVPKTDPPSRPALAEKRPRPGNKSFPNFNTLAPLDGLLRLRVTTLASRFCPPRGQQPNLFPWAPSSCSILISPDAVLSLLFGVSYKNCL